MCERKWKEVYQFRGQNVDNFENNNRERLKCKVQKRLGCDKEKLKKRKFEEKFDLKKKNRSFKIWERILNKENAINKLRHFKQKQTLLLYW